MAHYLSLLLSLGGLQDRRHLTKTAILPRTRVKQTAIVRFALISGIFRLLGLLHEEEEIILGLGPSRQRCHKVDLLWVLFRQF